MKKWLRLVLFLLIAAGGFALRDTLLKELQQPLGIVGWVGLAASVIQIGQLIWTLFEDKKSSHSEFSGLVTTPEKIRNLYVHDWRETRYKDRCITTPGLLRNQNRIVLVGPADIGKSREASELIQRAIDEGICLEGQVFDLSRGLNNAQIVDRLRGEINTAKAALIFVDDLPWVAASRDDLTNLSRCLAVTKECPVAYFVATARDEHLEKNQFVQQWISNQREPAVVCISMTPLDAPKAAELLDEQLERRKLNLTPAQKALILNQAEGMPYHLIQIAHNLASAPQPVDDAAVWREARKSVGDLWQGYRTQLAKIEPATRSLLEALAVFYQARVQPDHRLVLAFARTLLRSRWRRLPWLGAYHLNRALKMVRQYGIYYENPFIFPEISVESLVEPGPAISRLLEFMLAYHRGLRGRLAGLNRHGSLLQSALIDLSWSLINEKGEQSLDKALEAIEAAGHAAPPSAQLFFTRGFILTKMNDTEGAIEAYQAAIRLDPGYTGAHNNLGLLLFHKSDLAGAEAEFREAIGLAPQNPVTNYNLGLLFHSQGELDQAEAAYQEALRLDPALPQAHASLGGLRQEKGDPNRAEAEYQEALRLDPTLPGMHYRLGMLRQEKGDPNGAEAAYQEALRLDKEDVEAYINLGNLLRGQRRFSDAVDVYRRLIGFKPERASAHSSLAICLRALGQADEAKREMAEARRLSASDNTYNRACIAALSGDLDEAFTLLKKAIDDGHDRAWVAQDPDWDGLRDDPRYVSMMKLA